MIDLKELEKRLDDALAKETTESLSSWLLNQRKDILYSFLGVGTLASFKENPYSFNLNLPSVSIFKCTNEGRPSEQLADAA